MGAAMGAAMGGGAWTCACWGIIGGGWCCESSYTCALPIATGGGMATSTSVGWPTAEAARSAHFSLTADASVDHTASG